MLYTRRGDDGSSGLFDTKERQPKTAQIFEALGTLDELNSFIGLCRAKSAYLTDSLPIPHYLKQVQEHLFIIQAEVAGADKHITSTHVEELETMTAQVENIIENPHSFVIPGSNELSALFDVCRALARRAERELLRTDEEKSGILSAGTKSYLNRTSSLLYACARYTAALPGAHESNPTYQ